MDTGGHISYNRACSASHRLDGHRQQHQSNTKEPLSPATCTLLIQYQQASPRVSSHALERSSLHFTSNPRLNPQMHFTLTLEHIHTSHRNLYPEPISGTGLGACWIPDSHRSPRKLLDSKPANASLHTTGGAGHCQWATQERRGRSALATSSSHHLQVGKFSAQTLEVSPCQPASEYNQRLQVHQPCALMYPPVRGILMSNRK